MHRPPATVLGASYPRAEVVDRTPPGGSWPGGARQRTPRGVEGGPPVRRPRLVNGPYVSPLVRHVGLQGSMQASGVNTAARGSCAANPDTGTNRGGKLESTPCAGPGLQRRRPAAAVPARDSHRD